MIELFIETTRHAEGEGFKIKVDQEGAEKIIANFMAGLPVIINHEDYCIALNNHLVNTITFPKGE